MTQALTCPAAIEHQRIAKASIPLRMLAAALLALFALDNVLLLSFLGQPPLIVAVLALILPSILAFLTCKTVSGQCRIDVSTLAVCVLIAAILLIFGGEGRLLYATRDWQIRDAVLADMGDHGWPFDYWLDGQWQMLRAPVGMYLIPALVGGSNQLGRDWALLGQNSLVLGLLFALGSALFEGRRARLIALVTFVLFSGLDILGNFVVLWATGEARWDHIEDWANGYQYSSHLTQLFWVPQHALAGWVIALTYLLWRRKLAPVGLFAVTLPLVALWSPLVLFGAIPFALFAGCRVLWTREWDGRDVFLCAVAIILGVPALTYLSTDAGAVGGGLRPPDAIIYVLLILFEVMPFLLPVLRDNGSDADLPTALIVGICLFLMPSWTIGMFNDFQTRASIVPLALLAVAFAQWAIRIGRRRTKAIFLVILALGSATGGLEIANAIRFAPSPVPHCSIVDAWNRQTGLSAPHSTYFAARESFGFQIIPKEHVSAANPAKCWDHPWQMPRKANVERQSQP